MKRLRFCLDDEFPDECAGDFAKPGGNVQTLVLSSFRLNMTQFLLNLQPCRFCCLGNACTIVSKVTTINATKEKVYNFY